METPALIIVPEQEHQELRVRSRRWALGWIVAGLMLSITAGTLTAGYHLVRRLEVQSARIADLDERQRLTMKAQVATWEQQEGNIKLITGWAEYVKARAEISSLNGVALPTPPSKGNRVAGRQ